MYVQTLTLGSARNDLCCRGKAISITYSEIVFINLGLQHAMHMLRIIICGLPGYNTFIQCYTNNTIFLNKKLIEHGMCVLVLSATFVLTFLIL
jgi:hypothetical protein